MTPDKTILLDVGGTFIKCSDGRSVPVDSAGTREEIVRALREACGDAAEVRAAVPGPFDYAAGQFLMKHKFAAVYGKYFADLVGLPRENCRFIHDVNCMLLGQLRVCAGSNCADNPGKAPENTALVALGTGLGFAMCIDGEILRSELGSPRVSIFNRPYRDGVLEDYASKRGVLRLYGRDDLTVKQIAEKAIEGDRKAIEAFRRMGETIGDAIAPILKEYGVIRLILGGQISRSSQLFAPAILKSLKAEGLSGISVVPLENFDNATFNGLEQLL